MRLRKFSFFTGTVLLCAAVGFTAGFFTAKSIEDPVLPQTPKDPADALADARAAYEHFLKTGAETQWDITIGAGEASKLAQMEIFWLYWEIQNLPTWHGVNIDEKRYNEMRSAWQAKYDEAMSRPSDYEGGSMESADLSLRGISLMEKHIAELRVFRDTKRKEKTR